MKMQHGLLCVKFVFPSILLETSDLASQMQLIEISYSICDVSNCISPNNKVIMLYIFIIHSIAG